MNYRTISPTTQTNNATTIVVLHGYGTDENDLVPIASSVAPNSLIISLQAPIQLGYAGHAWYHLIQLESGLMPDDISRHESEEMIVQELAGIIKREGGDPKNVVFLGFSQGAAVIYSLLVTYNLAQYDLAARAAICLSGYIPRDVVQSIGEKNFEDFPMFAGHGELDDLIPVQALSEVTELFTASGAKVTSHVYACGHGVVPETIEDIRGWVVERNIL